MPTTHDQWRRFLESLNEQHTGIEFCAYMLADNVGAKHPREFVWRAEHEHLVRHVRGVTINESMYIRGASLGAHKVTHGGEEPFPLPEEHQL